MERKTVLLQSLQNLVQENQLIQSAFQKNNIISSKLTSSSIGIRKPDTGTETLKRLAATEIGHVIKKNKKSDENKNPMARVQPNIKTTQNSYQSVLPNANKNTQFVKTALAPPSKNQIHSKITTKSFENSLPKPCSNAPPKPVNAVINLNSVQNEQIQITEAALDTIETNRVVSDNIDLSDDDNSSQMTKKQFSFSHCFTVVNDLQALSKHCGNNIRGDVKQSSNYMSHLKVCVIFFPHCEYFFI